MTGKAQDSRENVWTTLTHDLSSYGFKHPHTPPKTLGSPLYTGDSVGGVLPKLPTISPPTPHRQVETSQQARIDTTADTLTHWVECWWSVGWVFANTQPCSNPSKQRNSERFGWGVSIKIEILHKMKIIRARLVNFC